MNHFRKFFCALLTVTLLAVSLLPAFAVSVEWLGDSIYLWDKKGGQQYYYARVENLTAAELDNFNFFEDVQSSNRVVVKPVSCNSSSSGYIEIDDDGTQSAAAEYTALVGFKGLKKGKATLSIAVDGEVFEKSVSVLGYVNPVKSFKLTGISNSNLKSKFSKTCIAGTKLKSKSKTGFLKVTAASGWKITNANWFDLKEGDERNFFSNRGASSISLITPAMEKKGQYYVSLSFKNTKTGGEIVIGYDIG